MLAHVSEHPKIMHTGQRNKTTRAGTCAQISNACKRNSAIMSEDTKKQSKPTSVLFRVVTQVSEDAGIKSALYPITACDNYPVFPGLHKVIIKNDFPLSMQELPVAERHKWLAWGFCATCLFHGKIVE